MLALREVYTAQVGIAAEAVRHQLHDLLEHPESIVKAAVTKIIDTQVVIPTPVVRTKRDGPAERLFGLLGLAGALICIGQADIKNIVRGIQFKRTLKLIDRALILAGSAENRAEA